MRQQFDKEIGPSLVCGKSGRWRPIFCHRSPHCGNPRAASLCQVKFLQKITNPTIPITACDQPATIQRLDPNGSIRAGITDDFDAIRTDPNFHWLRLFVTAMVNRIHHRLLNRCKGVIEQPDRLSSVLPLDHLLADHLILYVTQGRSHFLVNRTTKTLLNYLAAAGPLWKNHHLDLRARQKLCRIFAEEQYTDIPRPRKFSCPIHNIQLTTQLRQRQVSGFGKTTANVPEVIPDQRQLQITECGGWALPIVEGYCGRKRNQLSQILTVFRYLHCAGVPTNEVVILLAASSNVPGNLVRAILSTRCPKDNQLPAFKLLYAQNRKVGRLDLVAEAQQFSLNSVQLFFTQPHRRKRRSTIRIAILTDDDITTAQVFEVIRESAQCAHDCRRIPARLILDPVSFH